MSKLLTSTQVREVLKVDRITVYRMVHDGRLSGVKIGNQWRFHQSDIDNLLGKAAEPVESAPHADVLTDFPASCVQKIESMFAGILGVGVTTVNLEGEPLTGVFYSNPFCQMVLASPAGCRACRAEWSRPAPAAGAKPEFTVCHAGLCYLRAPVEIDGRAVAYVVSGQYLLKETNEAQEEALVGQVAKRYSLPRLELGNAAASIPVLKKNQQAQVEEWTPRLAATVQSILQERQSLVFRLQKISEMSSVRQVLTGNTDS